MADLETERSPTQTAGRLVVRNSLLMFGQHAFVFVITIFVAAMVARHLGTEDYGLYSYSFSFVAFFLMLSALGLRSVTVRTIAQRVRPLSEYLGEAFALRTTLAFASLPVFAALIWSLHADDRTRLALMVAALSIVFNGPATVFRDTFAGLERMEVEAVTAVGVRLFTMAGALLCVAGGGGVIAVIAVYSAGSLVQLAIPYFALRRSGIRWRPRFSLSQSRRDLAHGVPFFLNGLVTFFISRVNPILLGKLASKTMVGLYAAGGMILSGVFVIPDAVATALYPTVARGYADPSVRVEPIIQRVFFYMVLISAPIAVGGFLCGDAIIGLVFGEDFSGAVPVFKVLVLTTPLEFVSIPAFYLLGAVHRQRRALAISSVGAGVNVVLNFLFIGRLGALGSAVAVWCASAVCCAGALFSLGQTYRFFGDPRRYARLLLANALLGLAVAPFRDSSPLWVIPAAGVLYALALTALRVMSAGQMLGFVRQALGGRGIGKDMLK